MNANLITAVTTLRESMAALRLLKGGDRAEGAVVTRPRSILGLVAVDDIGTGARDGGVDALRASRRIGGGPTGQTFARVAGFGHGRVHKANSAESILRHCLQQRGWLKRWRAGKLTGLQHLKLLADIRKYGRAWLRHEAENLFRIHGVSGDDAGSRSVRDDVSVLCEHRGSDATGGEGVVRAIGSSALNAVRRWFDRVRNFVRELIYSGTMAMAGTETLNADDVAAAEMQVRKQDEYLENFRRELEANPPPELAAPKPALFGTTTITVGEPKPMSRNQAVARAELYGNVAWEAGQKTARREARVIPAAKFERRILGHPKTQHCEDCPPLAALGWVPVGTLPDIGDTECGNMCLCRFQYSDDAQAKVSHVPRKVKDSRRRPDLPKEDEAGGSLLKGDKVKPEKPTKGTPPNTPADRPAEEVIGPWVDENGNAITYHFEGP